MDKDRLLTQEEQDRITDDPIGCMEVPAKLLDAQDLKTAAIVQAATLRAVGEAFEARSFVVASNMPELDGKTAVYLEQSDLTALRAGQMPAGWERKE